MDELMFKSKLEQRMVVSATENLEPISGAFELLPLCNLNCQMCYIRRSKDSCERMGGLLPKEEWLRIAGEFLEAGTLFLLLTGGEPFLYPEFLELYQELHEMGFILTINTNGTLIGPKEARFLADHMPRRVNVTVYGTTPESYRLVTGQAAAYEKTLQGIRALLAEGIQVKMNVSLVKENASELEAFYRLAEEFGIPLEVNTYMYPVHIDPSIRMEASQAAAAALTDDRMHLSEEVYREKILRMASVYEQILAEGRDDEKPRENDEPERIPCRAARSSFWINWRGELSPCVFLRQDSVSLLEHAFIEGWKEVTEARAHLLLPVKCKTCKMRPFCQICGAVACHENGRMDACPEYLCLMTEEMLRLAYNEEQRTI